VNFLLQSFNKCSFFTDSTLIHDVGSGCKHVESKIIISIYWMGARPLARPVCTYTRRRRSDNRRRDRLQNVKGRASIVLLKRWNRK